jgi:predicted RNase H-like HicB family nuclease
MRSIVEKTSTGYSAFIEEMDGVVATGKTINDVKSELEKALLMHINGLKEDGELPEYLENPENLELTYKIDVETFFIWFEGVLTKSGVSRIAGINQSLVNQYALGIKTPGEKQLKKIEESIHLFGRDLMAINF